MVVLERILIPLDGSELSRLVFPTVSRIIAIDAAEVHLLRVLPGDPGAPGFEHYAQERLNAHHDLEQLVKRLRLPRTGVRIHLGHGDPADGILEAERRIEPSLIAMTTHGRTGFDRWVHGSVAERVLRQSTRPLLLVNPFEQMEHEPRPPEGATPIRKVIVPLDGSEESMAALKVSQAIGRLYDAELILIHVPPVLHRPVTYPDLYAAPEVLNAEERAHALLDPIRGRLEEAGQTTRIRVGKLPPAMAILQAIDDEEADLIAMTTHGRGGLSRWVFGSVAEKVLRNCRIPMLVLRAPAPRGDVTRELEKAWAHG